MADLERLPLSSSPPSSLQKTDRPKAGWKSGKRVWPEEAALQASFWDAELHGAGIGAFLDNIASGWLTTGGPGLRTQAEEVGIEACSQHRGLAAPSHSSSSAKHLGHGHCERKTRCVRYWNYIGVENDENPLHTNHQRNDGRETAACTSLIDCSTSTRHQTIDTLLTLKSTPFTIVPIPVQSRCPHNGPILDDGSLCRECAEVYCILGFLSVCLQRVKMSLNCRNALLPFFCLFLINLLTFAQCLWTSLYRQFLLQRHSRSSTRLGRRNLVFILNFLSLLSFGFSSCSAVLVITSNTGARSDLDPGKNTFPENPLLRVPRQGKFGERDNMCHIWTRHTPHDLCERGLWSRLKYLRDISLFSKDCDIEDDNIQLGQFLRLEWQHVKSAKDLGTHSEHLKDGIEGRSCLLGAVNSDECLKCFERIDNGLQMVDKAYQAFSRILKRFDCLLAVDSESATRPFSPNGTCSDCKRWYRKWALVQLIQIWKDPPCINWCYYAQLACPHLATNRVVDFGGHPAFLCRDLDIPQSQSGQEELMTRDGVSSCSCVHPCDLETSNSILTTTQSPFTKPKSFDFFADPEHCRHRLERCERENKKMAMYSTLDRDDAAVTGIKKRKKRRRRHNDEDISQTKEGWIKTSLPMLWLGIVAFLV